MRRNAFGDYALLASGTYFFTLNLLERKGNRRLIEHIDLLRKAVRRVKRKHPFTIHISLNPREVETSDQQVQTAGDLVTQGEWFTRMDGCSHVTNTTYIV